MNSSNRINMALWSSAATVNGADFILASLHTLQTTQKSEKCQLISCIVTKCYRILMATIRNMGLCPCPRCTIPLSKVHLLGTKSDRKARTVLARLDNQQRKNLVSASREAIYGQNFDIDSAAVERMLKPQSLVPTSVSICRDNRWFNAHLRPLQNAFSERLSHFDLNFFLLFVVDLMHEVELGVWRALFVHLLRILEAIDESVLHELDRR